MTASRETWEAWNMLRDDPDGTLSDPRKVAFCLRHLIRIKDKNERIIPLEVNATQRMIINAFCYMRQNNIPVRMIILKGRQQGSSTIVCALIMLLMLAYANRSALVQTEEKGGSAENMYDKYKLFLNEFPLLEEGRDWTDLCESYNNGSDLVLADLGSSLKTEGEKAVISRTLTSVHVSEAAFFNDFSTQFVFLMQCVPTLPNTAVFIESTAKQYGDGFHDHWNRAENRISNFMAIFAPWFIHEENEMDLPLDPTERDKFIKSIGQMQQVYGDELALKQQYNLTDEQIMFRRYRIDNDCDGSIEEFQRQYPSTSQEAFLAAERPVFDPLSISFLMERTKPREFQGEMHPESRYNKYDGTEKAEWRDTPNGAISVWEKPQPFEVYVIGSDHSEGIEGGDFNAGMTFMRNGFSHTCTIMGTEATRLDAIDYAKQLYYVARWYNWAYVCLEANHSSGGAVAALLSEWQYPNLIFEHQIFPQENNEQPANPRIGWLSNKGRRKDGIDSMINALSYDFKVDPPKPKSEWVPIVYDRELIEQCMHLTWKQSGKAEAKRKGMPRRIGSSAVGHHDDLVFAFISALFAHRSLPPPEPKEKRMIEQLGPDHELVLDLPDHIRRSYMPEKPKHDPYAYLRYQ